MRERGRGGREGEERERERERGVVTREVEKSNTRKCTYGRT